MKVFISYIFVFLVVSVSAQMNSKLEGRIINAMTNEPIPFCNVVISGTNIGTTSDIDGKFILTNVKSGFLTVTASSVGYETRISEEIQLSGSHKNYIEIYLNEKSVEVEEINIVGSPTRKTEESPVSLRSIGISEIEKNPGANRDVSKVISSFPGVSTAVSFRNDVIVRGGGSSENRFYLDDVEIPNLNHFATQGSSGGSIGMINSDFVREVNFYSGAFPANRANALSSVINIKQNDGNSEKTIFHTTVGASDLALTADGPAGENANYIFSVRRSYLQFLFDIIGLPFLPIYNDYQFKYRWKTNSKNEISIISLGALDQFELNKKANDTEYERYILQYIPVTEQWNYTLGIVYKHFRESGYDTYIISRNMLNNISVKYLNNIEVDSLLLQDYKSFESENKFRFEHNSRFKNGTKLNYGANAEYVRYFNSTMQKLYLSELNYKTNIDLFNYGLYGQLSNNFLGNRLVASAGMRTDASTYSKNMSNLLHQISPRFSLSYSITEKISFNTNAGRYFQRPAYTTMGYRDENGNYINRENNLKYIQAEHYIAGFEYSANELSDFTIEGFLKKYSNYPFSVNDSVSVANKGADYGVFGDEEVTSASKGRAYGFEILYRNKNLAGINTMISYTFVRSEFQNYEGKYIPSAWDNKQLITVIASKTFKNNFQIGIKWKYFGGTPYTPFDENLSSIKSAWDVRQRAYLDYSQFNTLRNKAYHQLDIRIDKEWFFNHWMLNLYFDIQNIYNFKASNQEILIRDEQSVNGQATLKPSYIDENGIERYYLKKLKGESGTVLPTIGIIFEF